MNPDFPAYTASIHHDGSLRYVRSRQSQAELSLGDLVEIRLRAAPEAPIERVFLRTCPDGEQQLIEMRSGGSKPACRWWQTMLELRMPVTGYRFLIFTADGPFWYNGSGLHRHHPTDAEDFRLLAHYEAPAWVGNSVFYQIFPDRFADGEPSNNVVNGEFEYWGYKATAKRWGEASKGGTAAMVEFYGGDLLGIEQRLDYLEDLGINALYLNPIFTASSNHRYDVTDYYHVDPHLGGNQALARLRAATALRNMRIILDIVPNHCGVNHPWFQAALANPQARTAEFFTFHTHPHDYASWLGMRGLPKLNYRSPELRSVMYSGPDSVFRLWLRPPFAIDGWRLDVANMLARQGPDQLGQEVGRGIRHAVKEENPAAFLLGENFFDGSPHLQGDMWDANMNYAGFSHPLWYWLHEFQITQHGQPKRVSSNLRWPTQALVDTWQAFRAAIPWVMARQQFNLLGSHDTPRSLTILEGNRALNRLAVGFLLTYVGVPSIYYGDEIGLWGPDSMRACMEWEEQRWDHELRSFYQTLIRLRRTSPALLNGGFQVLLVEEDTLAYLRDTDEEQIIVIGQRGEAPRPAGPLPVWQAGLPNGLEMVEVFSGRHVTVANGALPLAEIPQGVEIWRSTGG